MSYDTHGFLSFFSDDLHSKVTSVLAGRPLVQVLVLGVGELQRRGGLTHSDALRHRLQHAYIFNSFAANWVVRHTPAPTVYWQEAVGITNAEETTYLQGEGWTELPPQPIDIFGGVPPGPWSQPAIPSRQ